MDDYLNSIDSIEKGIILVKEVIPVHEKGGFEIARWAKNNIYSIVFRLI